MKISVSVLVLALILMSGVRAETVSGEDVDYIVKVLSKIDKYITWPSDKNYEGNGDLLVISVVGDSPVNEGLKGLDGTSTAGGKKFKVRFVEPNELPANSHILFVSGSDSALVQKALRLLLSRGTFIVGMSDGFGEQGCMLNFSKSGSSEAGKMEMELNTTSLKESSFQVNPAFLKLARVIN